MDPLTDSGIETTAYRREVVVGPVMGGNYPLAVSKISKHNDSRSDLWRLRSFDELTRGPLGNKGIESAVSQHPSLFVTPGWTVSQVVDYGYSLFFDQDRIVETAVKEYGDDGSVAQYVGGREGYKTVLPFASKRPVGLNFFVDMLSHLHGVHISVAAISNRRGARSGGGYGGLFDQHFNNGYTAENILWVFYLTNLRQKRILEVVRQELTNALSGNHTELSDLLFDLRS